MTIAIIILLFITSYLFGSISTAIIVCKAMGLPDPRSEGSKNPGATNVLRIGGKKAAFITLLGDMLKGTIPVVIARIINILFPELLGEQQYLTLGLIGLGAFIGHLLPAFFGFKGGKGVATALGVSLGWHWWLFLMTAGSWLICAFITRYSSLSALVAFALSPFYLWLFFEYMGYPIVIISLIISCFLFWRHHSNIVKLISGTEKKIGDSKK